MKLKLSNILPCLGVLILTVTVQYHNLTNYYDEIIKYSGFQVEKDFLKELKNENQRASKSQEKYNEIVEQEQLLDEGEKAEVQEETNTAKEDLSLHALSSLLMDASNQRVLYEENGYNEMPMASTTKIMTCIVTLENANLSDIVTVSKYAAKMPDVQLNINSGEQYYLKDLLYSLMLESHNDVAVAIAEHVGGSVEGFATMMNDKARSLGCDHTNFVTPNGLDAQGHYTTARDLAVIASYAVHNEKFIDITNTSSWNFKEITKGRGFTVTNKNRFLYMMEGAIGVKTGFTGGAGYCFVGAIKRDNKELISVVLGCGWPPNKSLKWADTKELMDYGIKNYKLKQIFDDVALNPLPVMEGQQKYETLSIKGDLTLLMRDDEKVSVKYDIPDYIKAPVEKDSIVGYAKYYINDALYAEIPIYTTQPVKKINFKFCFEKIVDGWLFGN
ncbi:MAG: hypothetical protein K0S47_1763 [Herbinix sp.]|jgi:D-alanyl-D-alanine carboxypeptidase (penicillin-binding protein 5/6)|nr:hypothetical protein [Herbinix sp.]